MPAGGGLLLRQSGLSQAVDVSLQLPAVLQVEVAPVHALKRRHRDGRFVATRDIRADIRFAVYRRRGAGGASR